MRDYGEFVGSPDHEDFFARVDEMERQRPQSVDDAVRGLQLDVSDFVKEYEADHLPPGAVAAWCDAIEANLLAIQLANRDSISRNRS